jgi:hypothetical protein
MPPEWNGIGCTDASLDISIGYGHKIAKSLSAPETASFFYGIGAHEVMHLLLTDFRMLASRLEEKQNVEKRIYHEIWNILEDSSIEHYIPQYIGGRMVRDLDFSKATIFKHSPPIDDERNNNAYAQFIVAAIAFGDAGVLKGKFTFPEAKKIFAETLPLWSKGIEEASAAKRFELAEEIFLASKPLWEDVAATTSKLDYNKLFDELMERLGKTIGENPGTSGLGKPPNGAEQPESERDKRRRITIRTITKEEKDEITAGNPVQSLPTALPDSDIEILVVEGEDENDGNEKPNAILPAEQNSKEEDDEDGENEDNEESAIKSLEDEGTLPDENKLDIMSELAKYERKVSEDNKSDKENKDIAIDIPLLSNGFKNVCKGVNAHNVNSKNKATETDLLIYANLIDGIEDKIHVMSMQFKKIFERARDEKQHRASGRYNADRAARSRLSYRVFDKNRESGNRYDTAVFILVDESGSMDGENIQQARLAAIGLAEALAESKIPLYIMGFTADIPFHTNMPTHYHYIKWRNTQKDRLRLLQINARYNNFDGFSIRQAHSMLEKRTEQNRLLIVISDGVPICEVYDRLGFSHGVADTKMAIREASKDVTVAGVLVGDGNPKIHAEMYGYNFLHIKEANELFVQLGGYLRKLIKGW